MSSIRLHIITGVNNYSENLLTKEPDKVNKRREVNFNVTDLGDYDKYNNRSKSFAIYKSKNQKPDKRRSKSFHIFSQKEDKNKKDNDNNTNNNNKDDENNEKVLDLNNLGNLFSKTTDKNQLDEEEDENINLDLHIIDDEDEDDNEDNDFNEEFKFSNLQESILDDNTKDTDDENSKLETKQSKKEKKKKDLEPKEPELIDNQGNFAGYKFQSSMIEPPEPKLEEKIKNDMSQMFQKFKDKFKEAFDIKDFKEKHDRNMEKMRAQMNLILEKLSKKKEEPEEIKIEEDQDYWKSGNNLNSHQINETVEYFKGKLKGKKHKNKIKKEDRVNLEIDGEFDSDNDTKKRCCC